MDLSKNQTWLISGDVTALPENGDLRNALEFLDTNIRHIFSEMHALASQEPTRVVVFGPFLARSLLEVCFTALTGRIDPFRLLSIHRIQKSPDYDRTIPWKAALRWQGDVVADAPSNAWSEKMDPQGMTRAALGYFYDHLLWQPALKRLSDYCGNGATGRWLPELLARPIAAFCGAKRGSVSALYSELSKSVHYEAVLPLASLDHVTVLDRINRCIREVSELALVAAFMEHPIGRLEPKRALDSFYELELIEVFP